MFTDLDSLKEKLIKEGGGNDPEVGTTFYLITENRASAFFGKGHSFFFTYEYMHLFNYMHLLEQKEEQLAPLDRSNIQRKHNICIDIN